MQRGMTQVNLEGRERRVSPGTHMTSSLRTVTCALSEEREGSGTQAMVETLRALSPETVMLVKDTQDSLVPSPGSKVQEGSPCKSALSSEDSKFFCSKF